VFKGLWSPSIIPYDVPSIQSESCIQIHRYSKTKVWTLAS